MEYLTSSAIPTPAIYPSGRFNWMRILAGSNGNQFGENIVDKTAIKMFGDLDMNNFKILNWSGGGGGGITGGTNLGTGAGVFSAVNGSNMEFKSLKAGTNVTITPSSTELLISSTGGGSTPLMFDYQNVAYTTTPPSQKFAYLIVANTAINVFVNFVDNNLKDSTALFQSLNNVTVHAFYYNNRTKQGCFTAEAVLQVAVGVAGILSAYSQKLNDFMLTTQLNDVFTIQLWTLGSTPSPLTSLRTTTTNQWKKVAATTTPAAGEFSISGGRYYFHKDDNTTRDASNNFLYLNSLLNAKIPVIFLLLNNVGGQVIVDDISVTSVGNVRHFQANSTISFVDGTLYTFDQQVINPQFIALNGGNDTSSLVLGGLQTPSGITFKLSNSNSINMRTTSSITLLETIDAKDLTINTKHQASSGIPSGNVLIQSGDAINAKAGDITLGLGVGESAPDGRLFVVTLPPQTQNRILYYSEVGGQVTYGDAPTAGLTPSTTFKYKYTNNASAPLAGEFCYAYGSYHFNIIDLLGNNNSWFFNRCIALATYWLPLSFLIKTSATTSAEINFTCDNVAVASPTVFSLYQTTSVGLTLLTDYVLEAYRFQTEKPLFNGGNRVDNVIVGTQKPSGIITFLCENQQLLKLRMNYDTSAFLEALGRNFYIKTEDKTGVANYSQDLSLITGRSQDSNSGALFISTGPCGTFSGDINIETGSPLVSTLSGKKCGDLVIRTGTSPIDAGATIGGSIRIESSKGAGLANGTISVDNKIHQMSINDTGINMLMDFGTFQINSRPAISVPRFKIDNLNNICQINTAQLKLPGIPSGSTLSDMLVWNPTDGDVSVMTIPKSGLINTTEEIVMKISDTIGQTPTSGFITCLRAGDSQPTLGLNQTEILRINATSLYGLNNATRISQLQAPNFITIRKKSSNGVSTDAGCSLKSLIQPTFFTDGVNNTWQFTQCNSLPGYYGSLSNNDEVIVSFSTQPGLSSMADVIYQSYPPAQQSILEYSTDNKAFVSKFNQTFVGAIQGNFTSSGVGSNTFTWMQGTFNQLVVSEFSYLSANNKFVCQGGHTTPMKYIVTYNATPALTSTDRQLQIVCWKNSSADTNPSGGFIYGSRSVSINRSSVNNTSQMCSTFYVDLVSNDTIQFFIRDADTSPSGQMVVDDFSLSIIRL